MQCHGAFVALARVDDFRQKNTPLTVHLQFGRRHHARVRQLNTGTEVDVCEVWAVLCDRHHTASVSP